MGDRSSSASNLAVAGCTAVTKRGNTETAPYPFWYWGCVISGRGCVFKRSLNLSIRKRKTLAKLCIRGSMRFEPRRTAVRCGFYILEPQNRRFWCAVPDLGTGTAPFRGLSVLRIWQKRSAAQMMGLRWERPDEGDGLCLVWRWVPLSRRREVGDPPDAGCITNLTCFAAEE